MTSAELHYEKMTKTTVSMLITCIYNMADTYFVGTLDESAQAATVNFLHLTRF